MVEVLQHPGVMAGAVAEGAQSGCHKFMVILHTRKLRHGKGKQLAAVLRP